MPAIFPELLPDELLYSAIARYREMMNFSSQPVLHDVFGSGGTMNAIIDLPTRIEAFIERLPPGHNYQAVAVLRDHTTLPYYTRFLSADRVEHATAIMLGRRAGHVPSTLGIGQSRVISPRHLNYCEACRCADREAFGTAYWHRVHQLPGVFVCPEHAVILHRSPYGRAVYTSRSVLHPLDQYLPPSGIAENISSVASDPTYLAQIAEDSRWLLTTWGGSCGVDALRDRFRVHVSAAGFIAAGGNVRIDNLRTALTAHYGQAFLAETGCNIALRSTNDWLCRLLRMRGPITTFHPLHYILLARLLGSSIRDVLHPDLPINAGPDGGIQNAGTVRPKTSDGGRRRIGPSPGWEDRLKALVVDSTETLAAIAAELGVAKTTVQRHAHRLGVWRNEWKLSKSILSRATVRRQRLCDEYQRAWLALRAAHPTLSRTQLSAMRPSVYVWLARNEYAWLDAHSLPKQALAKRNPSHVNWPERDEQALRAARTVVRELLTDPSGARRVTLAGIGNKVGMLRQLQVPDGQLPRTAAYVSRAVQIRHRWERRRLYHAVMEQLVERTVPRPSNLAARASIGRTIRPGLRDLAIRAVDAIRRTIEFGEPFVMDWSNPMSPGGERDA